MTNPFVPSGREFDEGLGPSRKRRGIGRLVDRLTRRRAPGERSKMRDFELTMDTSVAQRDAARRTATTSRRTVEPPAATPTVTPPRPTPRPEPKFRTQRPTAGDAPEQRTPAHARRSLTAPSAQLEQGTPGGTAVVAGWIACHNAVEASQRVLDHVTPIARASEGSLAVVLQWWLAAHHRDAEEMVLAVARAKAAEVPEDLVIVMDYVRRLRAPALATYDRAASANEALAEATRRINTLGREYPTLSPIVSALRRRDIKAVTDGIASLEGGWDSAARHAANRDLTRAVTSLREAVRFGEPPQWSLPKDWSLDPLDQPDRLAVAGVASSMLPSRQRQKVESRLARTVLDGLRALDVDARRDVESWLGSLGASLAPSAVMARRRLVPATPPSPAAATSSAATTRAAKKLCRMCGVNEPSRGSVCESCAEMRD